MRGEQLYDALNPTVGWGSPPLARGTDISSLFTRHMRGITPACAGNRCCTRSPVRSSGDHPRLRGEQVGDGATATRARGSPPLARGTVAARPQCAASCGITPACAGNSPTPREIGSAKWDHPRLRGEQRYIPLCPRRRGGSPPLARGTAEALIPFSEALRITPACAGNRSEI